MFRAMTIMTFSNKTCTYAIISPTISGDLKPKKVPLNTAVPEHSDKQKGHRFGISEQRASDSPEPLGSEIMLANKMIFVKRK